MNLFLLKPLLLAGLVAASSADIALAASATEAQTISLGGPVDLRFTNLSAIIHGDKQRLTNATLFLNDLPMKGLHPVAASYASNSLRFELSRTKDNNAQWKSLLNSTSAWQFDVRASVGFEDDLEHVESPKNATLHLTKFSGAWWTAAAAIIVVAVLFLLIIYGARSNLLRESTPLPKEGFKQKKPVHLWLRWLPGLQKEVRATGRDRPPFSLGRVQMAVWFSIIFICYIYIWLVLDDRNCFNGTALTLLGITLATGLVSRGIDVSKQDTVRQLDVEKNQLEARQTELDTKLLPLTDNLNAELARVKVRIAEIDDKMTDATILPEKHRSDGFLTDILSDQNGISLQRLQMLGWTLVLGLVFVAGVLKDYAMPDFDNTLLGLMGISSGAFLGFKVPEKNPVPKPRRLVPGKVAEPA